METLTAPDDRISSVDSLNFPYSFPGCLMFFFFTIYYCIKNRLYKKFSPQNNTSEYFYVLLHVHCTREPGSPGQLLMKTKNLTGAIYLNTVLYLIIHTEITWLCSNYPVSSKGNSLPHRISHCLASNEINFSLLSALGIKTYHWISLLLLPSCLQFPFGTLSVSPK